MSEIKLAKAAERIQWSKDFQREYTAESPYRPLMGTGSSMPIRVRKDLEKKAGDTLRIDYFRSLTGEGVTGSTALEGAEEALANMVCEVRAQYFRHATVVGKDENFKTDIDLANVARDSLKSWSTDKFDDDLREAMSHVVLKGSADGQGSFIPDTYVGYADATATQKNAWQANNVDRILFGSVKGADADVTHSTAITAVTETLSARIVQKAKTLARQATSYRVRPMKVNATAGREMFVLVTGSDGYDQLFNDEIVFNINKDARSRGIEDHPLFQSGDLMFNGVLIREDPLLLANQSYLMGADALAVGYAQYAMPVVQRNDYGRSNGIGIEEIRGQNKFSVAGKQTGMVTIFHD